MTLRPDLLGEVLFALRSMRNKKRKELAGITAKGGPAHLQAMTAARLDRIDEAMTALRAGDAEQTKGLNMGVVMKVIGTGIELFPQPVYLKAFNVEAFDGRGDATWTLDIHDAMVFADPGAVLTAWKTQSLLRPLRADGKPNRPLTTFTIEIECLPEEAGEAGLSTTEGKAK